MLQPDSYRLVSNSWSLGEHFLHDRAGNPECLKCGHLPKTALALQGTGEVSSQMQDMTAMRTNGGGLQEFSKYSPECACEVAHQGR